MALTKTSAKQAFNTILNAAQTPTDTKEWFDDYLERDQKVGLTVQQVFNRIETFLTDAVADPTKATLEKMRKVVQFLSEHWDELPD